MKNLAQFAASLVLTLACLFGLTAAAAGPGGFYDATAIHKKAASQTIIGSLSMTGNVSASAVYAGTGGVLASANQTLGLRGYIADGATAVGVRVGNVNALTTAGSKIVSFYSDNLTTEKAYIDKDGSMYLTSAAGITTTLGVGQYLGGGRSYVRLQGEALMGYKASDGYLDIGSRDGVLQLGVRFSAGETTGGAPPLYISGVTQNLGLSDITPNYRLDVAGGDIRLQSASKLYFGGTGAGDADVYFQRSGASAVTTNSVLTAAPVYGQIYWNFDGTQKTVNATPTAGDWYAYGGAITDGPCSQLTCDGAHSQITVSVAGTYQVDIRTDATSDDSGSQIMAGLSIAGADPAAACLWQNGGIAASAPGPGVSCIAVFTAGQTAKIVFSSDSTDPLRFTQLSMRLVRLN